MLTAQRLLICTASLLLATQLAARPATDPDSLRSAATPAAPALSAQSLASVLWLEQPSWSPDGRQVAYLSDASGLANIWVADVESGRTHALKPENRLQESPQWAPDGKRLLFQSDVAGDEMYDLFSIDVATGSVSNLTHSAGQAETNGTWSPDGHRIAYALRDRAAAQSAIAVLDLRNGRVRVLAHATDPRRTDYAPFWSPRGDWIYYTEGTFAHFDSSVMRVRPDGTGRSEMTPHKTPGLYTPAAISPEGDSLLITAEAQNGWQNVATVAVPTRQLEWLTDQTANFNAGGFSPDGRTVALTRDVGLDTQILLFDRSTHALRVFRDNTGLHDFLPDGIAPHRQTGSPFSPDGRSLLYVQQDAATPTRVVTARIDEGAERVLVDNPVPAAAQASLATATAVHFPSTDGKFDISAIVWMPRNLKPDGSNPALVDIHGGPGEQARASFDQFPQTLAASGYIVMRPNFRGSTAHGRDFYTANFNDQGGGDLADIEAAADWLARSRYVDPHRIASMGDSYGGYLTLMALGKSPDRFAAGVAMVPFVDNETDYDTEAPWIQAMDRERMQGPPQLHAEFWRQRSPLYFADRIRKPVLMSANANDPRSSPEQARSMAAAIRAHGGNVDLKIYGGLGHEPDGDAYVDLISRTLQFLNRYVRDAP